MIIQLSQPSEDEAGNTTPATNPVCKRGLSQEKAIGYDDSMVRVSSTLRAAFKTSGKSRSAISHATGIGESVLHKFVVLGKQLRSDSLDKLAAYFEMELTKTKGKSQKVK